MVQLKARLTALMYFKPSLDKAPAYTGFQEIAVSVRLPAAYRSFLGFQDKLLTLTTKSDPLCSIFSYEPETH